MHVALLRCACMPWGPSAHGGRASLQATACPMQHLQSCDGIGRRTAGSFDSAGLGIGSRLMGAASVRS